MASEPKDSKDISIKRIIIVVSVLGSVFFLLTSVSWNFPNYSDIIGRLLVTLACAVVIVKIHGNFENSNSQDEDEPRIEVRGARYSMLTRILIVWLGLFILNTVFFAF